MEVMCLSCKKMFSVDDNEYAGDWENFCSPPCHRKWLEEKSKEEEKGEGMRYGGVNPFVFMLEDKDGK
jgi:hypothetical protein